MTTPGPLNANYVSLVEPFIDVKKDFHAAGDGISDDSAAINAAISAAATNFGAGTVYFPPGLYLCKSTITLLSQVHLRGSGIEATIIKLANAANTDLMSANTASINLSASFGTGSAGGVFNWSLADLTLDGNKANQSSGTSYCLRVYGYGYMIRNTRFRNGYTGGILADWNGGTTSPGQDQVESEWTDVKIHDNNAIGLEFGGPHDSQFENISIFTNGTHGLHIAPNAQYCMWANMRVYGITQSVSAVAILAEAISNLFVNCTAQDSDTVNLVLLANEIQWIGHVIGGTGAASTSGVQIGQAAGNTPYTGMINQSAGVTTAIIPLGCYIEGIFTSNLGTNGQIWLANDGGNNNIRVNCQQASGSTLTGTQASSTQLQIAMNGLTSDGTLAKGGWYRLAVNANKALTVSDRTNDVFNVNSNAKRIELVNGTLLRLYSDAGYATRTTQLDTTLSVTQSAAAAAIASSGTITTAAVGIARLNPAAAATSVVMQAGTIPGQQCWVLNEATVDKYVQMDVSGTSNVADGINCVIPGLSAKLFVWDSGTSLWYETGQIINGTINFTQSSSAVALAQAGTITTNGIGVARLNPAAARTACIMQAGIIPGQTCLVVNEAAFANSVQMDVAATSNVASGGNCVIPGQSSRLFVWDSATSRWYDFNLSKLVQNASQVLTINDGTNDVLNVNATNKRIELVNNTLLRIYSDSGYTTRTVELSNGTISTLQSTSATAITDNATITTSGVGIARVNPAANRTGIILQAGTLSGQHCWVINESALTVTFAAASSNVADGNASAIAANVARLFVWDGGTSLWYRAA